MSNIDVPQQPLQNVIPSYPYQQYADDPNVVAWFNALNTLGQEYLNWFNQTPLGVYTSPSITGPLLDWVLGGIYGIDRPVFSSLASASLYGLNSLPINVGAINGGQSFASGTATLATDDYYKRVATWTLYNGDGYRFTIPMLRLKVARFLYGVNGTDVTLAQAQNVSIAYSSGSALAAGLGAVPLNITAIDGENLVTTSGVARQLIITVPAGTSSSYFQQAFTQGILPFPFQISASVVVL